MKAKNTSKSGTDYAHVVKHTIFALWVKTAFTIPKNKQNAKSANSGIKLATLYKTTQKPGFLYFAIPKKATKTSVLT